MRNMPTAAAMAPFTERLHVNEMTTKDNAWVLVTGASSGFGEEFAPNMPSRAVL
jgi:hypothetical protein